MKYSGPHSVELDHQWNWWCCTGIKWVESIVCIYLGKKKSYPLSEMKHGRSIFLFLFLFKSLPAKLSLSQSDPLQQVRLWATKLASEETLQLWHLQNSREDWNFSIHVMNDKTHIVVFANNYHKKITLSPQFFPIINKEENMVPQIPLNESLANVNYLRMTTVTEHDLDVMSLWT